jgi:hypothetical protein
MATKPKGKPKGKNPMLTKTGKTRLGPLNVEQLTKLIDSTSKKKVIARIQRALAARKLTQQVSKKPVAAPVVEESVAQ